MSARGASLKLRQNGICCVLSKHCMQAQTWNGPTVCSMDHSSYTARRSMKGSHQTAPFFKYSSFHFIFHYPYIPPIDYSSLHFIFHFPLSKWPFVALRLRWQRRPHQNEGRAVRHSPGGTHGTQTQQNTRSNLAQLVSHEEDATPQQVPMPGLSRKIKENRLLEI